MGTLFENLPSKRSKPFFIYAVVTICCFYIIYQKSQGEFRANFLTSFVAARQVLIKNTSRSKSAQFVITIMVISDIKKKNRPVQNFEIPTFVISFCDDVFVRKQ